MDAVVGNCILLLGYLYTTVLGVSARYVTPAVVIWTDGGCNNDYKIFLKYDILP